ncbi:hypothetical protein L1987_10009 [Smallanthus sonchifolius]|uniref:Uncharacterized protein n=1 Tax=Smallanthus sonchifolius TaxID=185202 RepID=A0ACB9JQX1_9ASTR|nr:hypothetical protein L1987_10009 [Smallanthus sonchifolius]
MAFKGMGFLVLSFCYILFSPKIASAATFDVTSYGAKGDGSTDDSKADLCGDDSADPTLVIPSGMTFLISPLVFNGSSCQSPNVNIKALHFHKCPGLRLKGTTHINSPFLHISIIGCQDVDIGNLQITAPENSPNTDGIDIGASSHINIHDSNIQTGDDCVAINGGVVDVNVTNVLCGPGHGISIGSLGEKEGHDTVEQVRVQNCNITGTRNGLRIKTVPNGTGYARGIIFQDINLINVRNPIIIDQYYCNSLENDPSAEAVQVSDVTYTNIHGSSETKQAIIFNCSEKYKCTNIMTNNVHITGGDDLAYCRNAQGEFIDTTPTVSCD